MSVNVQIRNVDDRTVADAYYVVLAAALDAVLVTCDRGAVQLGALSRPAVSGVS